MKYAILLISTLFLLTGCGGKPVDTDHITAPAPFETTDNCGWYKEKAESLELRLADKEADIANMNNQVMQLSSELQTTQLALSVQRSLHEQQLAQLTDIINGISQGYVIDVTTIEAYNQQYLEAQARMKVITDAMDNVWNESVVITSGNTTMALSDNLTAQEYKGFYKGWELWWWTFNEKDE